MFGMLESLTKAAIGVAVETPIAIVSDVVTLGGSMTEKDQPYTATALENVVKNVADAVKPKS
jgi:hypothetical protein